MKKLATSLESLHEALEDRKWRVADDRLRKDVTGQFTKIADMVGYAGHPSNGSDDKSDEEDDKEDKMEMDEQSDEGTKKSVKFEENECDESSNIGDSSARDSSYDVTNNVAEQTEKSGEVSGSDGNSTGNDQNNVTEKDTTPINNADSVDDDKMMSTNNSNGSPKHRDIAQYVKGMKNKGIDISEATMSGNKQVKAVLDLVVIPKLGSKEQKKYF